MTMKDILHYLCEAIFVKSHYNVHIAGEDKHLIY